MVDEMARDPAAKSPPATKKTTAKAKFVPNPTTCTAPYFWVDLTLTPFMAAIAPGEVVSMVKINRAPVDRSVCRSPWEIKMMNRRHDTNFPTFYRKYLVEEAEVVRDLSSYFIAGAKNPVMEKPASTIHALAVAYCTKDLASVLAKLYDSHDGPHPLQADLALNVAKGMLSGLCYLHDKVRLLHGDLKSYNVLWDGGLGPIKLCGFGRHSFRLDGQSTPSEQIEEHDRKIALGLWSAPELFMGKPDALTFAADIWSFGLVVFEMLTGYPPHTFPGVMDEAVAEPEEMLGMRKPLDRSEVSHYDEEVEEDYEDEMTDDEEEEEEEEDPDCMMMPGEDGPHINLTADIRHRRVFARKRAAPNDVAVQLEEGEVGAAETVKKVKPADDEDCVEVALPTVNQETIDLAIDDDAGEKGSLDVSNGLGETVPPLVALDEATTPAVAVDAATPATPAEEVTSTEVTTKAEAEEKDVVPSSQERQEDVVPSTQELPDEVVPSTQERQEAVKLSSQDRLDTDSAEDMFKSYEDQEAVEQSASDEALQAYLPKPQQAPCEVVMVLDSSDEEHEGDHRGEEDADYSYDRDEELEDEDDVFINYASLGTRPPIPVNLHGPQHQVLLEMFCLCTADLPQDRPSAAQLYRQFVQWEEAARGSDTLSSSSFDSFLDQIGQP